MSQVSPQGPDPSIYLELSIALARIERFGHSSRHLAKLARLGTMDTVAIPLDRQERTLEYGAILNTLES